MATPITQIGLAAPAVRALQAAGYGNVGQLAGVSRKHLASLHGMGPNALKKIEQALAARGLAPLGK